MRVACALMLAVRLSLFAAGGGFCGYRMSSCSGIERKRVGGCGALLNGDAGFRDCTGCCGAMDLME